MPSSRALQSAQAFFSGAVPSALVRQECGIENVPRSDEGLRMLAAEGNWGAVALLAEQLGTDATNASGGGGAVTLKARLQYVLVQVTAYFHMRSYAAAKRLIDVWGDLHSDRFADPATGQSLVPFSLHFAAALLPMHCGAPMDTQRRLYALLSHCEGQRAHIGETVRGAAEQWVARSRRVERALAVTHFQAGQYAEALRLLERFIAAERYDSDDVDYTAIRQIMHLQQLATWSLQCGHAVLAEDAFAAIERLSTSDETADVRQFHHFIVALNQGIRLTANDKFDEAAHVFREVARGTREHCRLPPRFLQAQQSQQSQQSQQAQRGVVPTVSELRRTMSAGAHAQSALCRMAFQRLWTHAATSHVACMLYETTRGKNPVALIPAIIDAMEAYIRQGPVELLHVDVFLANSVRIYTLEGDTQQRKIERLADLVEVFRCDKASAPVVEKM